MVLPIPRKIIRPMQRTRSGALHFSADNLSVDDRVSYWRELFGRQTVGLDIEPLHGAEFFGDLTLHALPGLRICRGITSGGRTWRTPELISDGNDDVSLWVNLEGPVAVSRRGEEIVLGEQEAVLGTLGEVGGFTRRTPGRHLCLQIPRAAIAPLVPAVDDAVARRIPRDSTALRLLASYADTLHEHETSADPRFDRQIVNHIYDLTAVIIGATRDAMEVARGRGVRAARLRAIKTDIVANLGRGDLSADALAARHGITARYLRMLFENEGTSFSEFVLGQRLLRAHRMLCAPLHLDRAVGSIAFECGFGDISYFYRAFRRKYGDTPSDVRQAARREQE
jgi:AraC-like DNA-binding protein